MYLKPANNKGFIALLTMLCVGTALLIIVIPTIESVSALQRTIANTAIRQANYYNAYSCLEIAKLRYSDDPTAVTTENINLRNSSCSLRSPITQIDHEIGKIPLTATSFPSHISLTETYNLATFGALYYESQ